MDTLRLDTKSENYISSIETAADIIRRGGVVAMPTETVYGLAASAYSNTAINKVFTAKGRPQDNPLIVHISDLEMLNVVARDITDTAYDLIHAFWPGPLTLIFKKTNAVCESVSAGLSTVAVRMPASKVALDLIRAAKLPLAAPSANISGAPSPTSAQHVINDLDGKIDAILMGDDCEIGVESTVVSLVGDKPRLLRPGAVTVEQLRELLPDLIIDDAVLNMLKDSEVAASPGMKYKHYSPKTPVYLVEGESFKYINFVNGKKDSIAVCFDDEADDILVPHIAYGNAQDLTTLAHNLFDVLRSLDERSASAAYIHAPKKSGVGLAVYNRLIRAAAFRVISL